MERVVIRLLIAYLQSHNLCLTCSPHKERVIQLKQRFHKPILTSSMPSKKETFALLSLLDLTAAFDMLDNAILLQRLSATFRVKDRPPRWFQSYLRGQTQSVHLATKSTAPQSVKFGVPQGSVLRLILPYPSLPNICSLISTFQLCHHCYANDTELYGSC